MHAHTSVCTRMEYMCDYLYCTFTYICVRMQHVKKIASAYADYVSLAFLYQRHVSSACVGASCVTVRVLNVDPALVSQRTRHKVCHHPVTMAPNLAETRRRQGAPCHRGNTSGMLPPPPTHPPEIHRKMYTHCPI